MKNKKPIEIFFFNCHILKALVNKLTCTYLKSKELKNGEKKIHPLSSMNEGKKMSWLDFILYNLINLINSNFDQIELNLNFTRKFSLGFRIRLD